MGNRDVYHVTSKGWQSYHYDMSPWEQNVFTWVSAASVSKETLLEGKDQKFREAFDSLKRKGYIKSYSES